MWTWRSALIAPSLVTLLVGLRYISTVPLWVDELWVWASVNSGLGTSFGEPFQLPLYTMEWLLTGGGRCLSEACLRWPGLLAAAGAVWLVGLIATRIAGRRAGLAASILLMGIALVQRSTLEAHHYSVSAMLIALTLLLLQVSTERPLVRWTWVTYAVTMILAGTLQPVTLAAVGGHAVLVWLSRDRQVLRRWLITLGCLTPLVVTALILYLRSGSYGSADTHGQLVPSPENAAQLLIWPISTGVLNLPAVGAIAAILLMLALSTATGQRWLLAGVVPVVLVYLVSLGPRDFWFGRFLWPFVGFFIVAAAIAFRDFSRVRYAGLLGLVLLLCYPLFIAQIAPWSRGTDFRTAMALIDSLWQPGDAVHVGSPNEGAAVALYGTRDSYVTTDLFSSPDERIWSFSTDPTCPSPENWTVGPNQYVYRCPTSP